MNETKIIFYEKNVNAKVLEDRNLKDNILIKLDELREKKSTVLRFLEKEIESIPLLKRFFKSNLLFKAIITHIRPNYRNLEKKNYISKHFRVKAMSNYIDADIYETADKVSVKLFDEVNQNRFIKRLFIFSNFNLYQTNRLEFVETYYQLLLTFLTIIKIIEQEKPVEIVLLSSVNIRNRIIINAIAKKYKVSLLRQRKKSVKKNSFLQRYLILIERLWYWNIWRILNPYNHQIQRKSYKYLTLIFAHYKNHFPALIPVLKAFSESKNVLHLIYTPHKLLSYAKTLFKKFSIENAVILPHLDRNYSQFKQYYMKFKNILEEIIHSDSLENVKVNNIDIKNLIKLVFVELNEKLINSFRYLTNITYVIKKFEPNLIVLLSGNDPIDMMATRIVKKMKIPSLFYPHAMFSARRDHAAFEQDYVVCGGEKDRAYFSSLGTQQEKLYVLGLPLYDKLFQKYVKLTNRRNIQEKIIEKLRINSQKKILALVTTHDEDFVRERVFRSVIEVINKHKDYFLIVKIHPVEDINYYLDLSSKYHAKNLIIVKDVDLHDVLLASEVIIGRSSGAQIEAILFNKNVIDLSYEAESGRQLMEKFNAVIPVYDPSNLEKAINDCLYNREIKSSLEKGRASYSSYALYKFDGKASTRITHLIEKILQ